MDSVTTIFIDDKGTLRSGWRIAVFLFGYFFVSSLVSVMAFSIFGGSDFTTPDSRILWSVVPLIPALLVGSVLGNTFEKLPFAAIGVPISGKAAMNLLLGCAVGVATFAFAVLIAVAGGGLSFTQNPEVLNTLWPSIGVPLLVFAAAAAFEEAFFRGYIFQTLTRSGYAWLAILITAVPFGVVHLGNPNAGVISTINTVLAGVWFGLAYLKTRDLWFVWGVHWFWNWTQGSVFGIEVSGLTDLSAGSLLIETDAGPHWLTGTTYGIEGGIACTFAIVISIIVIKFIPQKENEPQIDANVRR
ncbi:MAG: CPBP family intramembrane metalloprotease [Blastocatellia bacterium]|nr:CPBP family intramembrane metalloprotease [Blastocatellia bacterium]